MSRIACIYHSVDLDGYMSAAIVEHWFMTSCNKKSGQTKFLTGENIVIAQDDVITFIGYNYGQPIPDLSEYDKVIMCDISFPTDIMLELGRKLSMNFIYIDHHISAIIPIEEEIRNNNSFAISGIRDTKFAACELTWLNFFNSTPMPEIVRLLGRYDCFGHKGTDEEQTVLEFQYGARQVISNYEDAYIWLTSLMYDSNDIDVIKQNGRAIYKYLCQEAKQTYATKFDLVFRRDIVRGDVTENGIVKFAAINKNRFNPVNFGIDYHADGYDGVASFWYEHGKLCFSLYNDNGLVDCSAIAKQFGGGGHKGASGFVLYPNAIINDTSITLKGLVSILGSLDV